MKYTDGIIRTYDIENFLSFYVGNKRQSKYARARLAFVLVRLELGRIFEGYEIIIVYNWL